MPSCTLTCFKCLRCPGLCYCALWCAGMLHIPGSALWCPACLDVLNTVGERRWEGIPGTGRGRTQPGVCSASGNVAHSLGLTCMCNFLGLLIKLFPISLTDSTLIILRSHPGCHLLEEAFPNPPVRARISYPALYTDVQVVHCTKVRHLRESLAS